MTLNSRLLEGKVALVTGASRGIGRSIVERFASEGATVYANSRQAGSIDPICMDLSCQHSTEVIPVYYDVTDSLKTKDVFVKIMKERKQLDILVNNAGVMEDALIGMISLDLMHKIFDTNVFAVINHLQLAARLMKKGKSGSIINLSSIVGMNGNPGQSVYSASKGAVVALTKTAAKELGPDHIRVNAIAPGMIDTDMYRSIGEEKMSEHLGMIKLGRIGNPEDIADAALFLASDLSRYVTGQILGVDGGAIV
ncbi:MAG: SDR family NAD(P)-dependent oxidoreductase [Peptococcales bacterium]|jgi:3-oxoacyl-[acyl-carrier protein] reductase